MSAAQQVAEIIWWNLNLYLCEGLLGGLYYITWACSSPFVGHLIKLQGPHVKQLYLGCILLTITA